MDKKDIIKHTKSRRMVGYLATVVTLLAVAFILLIACVTYIIENQTCDASSRNTAGMTQPESCNDFHYEGYLGNTTFTEYIIVCENTKTEFGIVRDEKTGYVMNTFFKDYNQNMRVVYLAKSHTCLSSHDLETDFEDEIAHYRNNQLGQRQYQYRVGKKVESWNEIPQNMHGFCSQRNTFRWLEHAPDSDIDGLRLTKRHYGYHVCCCYILAGDSIYIDHFCAQGDTCLFSVGVLCQATVEALAHPDCPINTLARCNLYGVSLRK